MIKHVISSQNIYILNQMLFYAESNDLLHTQIQELENLLSIEKPYVDKSTSTSRHCIQN